VLTWPAGIKVFVCTRATDMRCGFDTLAAQVTWFLAQDPLSGHLFVFRSRKGDRIKVLYWDTDGYALWCKRLERGTVKLSTVDPDATRVVPAGDDGRRPRADPPRARPRRRSPTVPLPSRPSGDGLALPPTAGGVEGGMEVPPAPTLPSDVPTLQAMVRELHATVADLRKTVEAQQHRIDDLAEAERACPCCGKARVRIGAETSEQLDYRPASLFVVERVRHTYACPACSRTADPADDPVPTIATAPLPAQPIYKGIPGPGLLAHVVVSKFADHLSLYRQEGILTRHRVAVPRSTLGGWVAAAAALLNSLVERMAELVRQSRVIQTDDTPVPVLNPGSRRTRTVHLWV
jgi:transposase